MKFFLKDLCLFREEFIISHSPFPEENYNSEEKKYGSWGKNCRSSPKVKNLIGRSSCMPDSCQEKSSFFPMRTKFFRQELVNRVFFCKGNTALLLRWYPFKERIVGLLLRFRIPMRRISRLILVRRILVLSTRKKFFCQESVNGVFFWKETLLSSAKNQFMIYSSESKHSSQPKVISI